MIQRIYIDTSVIGGLFDIEFSDDTKPFFDRVEKGEIKIVYSEITTDELADAPEQVRDYFKRLTSKQRICSNYSRSYEFGRHLHQRKSCW